MEFKTLIGLKINHLRSSHGLSQEEFVGQLSVSITRGQLSKYETGKNMPNLEVIRSISKAFNVPASWLLGVDEYNDITESEYDLIYKFRELPEGIKLGIETIINTIYNK